MSKPNPRPIRLGRLELRIMNVVWDRGRATVHDVRDTLARGRKPAYSTILTMMRKLEAKGYLGHDVDGRTFVYRPALTRRRARRSLLLDLLDRLFDGSPELLVSSLIEEKRITAAELREIRKLIRQRARSHDPDAD